MVSEGEIAFTLWLQVLISDILVSLVKFSAQLINCTMAFIYETLYLDVKLQ